MLRLYTLLVLVALTCALNLTYDYIIVGGGLTGLVVANHLSENPNKTVLVIENGYIDDSFDRQAPYLSGVLNRDPPLYKSLISTPDPELGNHSFSVAVGNVLGGGSVVHGMMLDRGSDADYDAWAELGNVGWGWDGLEAYFKKPFTFTAPSTETVEELGIMYDESVYGDGLFPDYVRVFAAWKSESGVPKPKEGFARPLGAFWAPNTVDNRTGTRSSAKTAYYDPVKLTADLKLLVGTHVDEILLAESNGAVKATGVRMTQRNASDVSHAFASLEVILAAGSIFTPHLLRVSGIGPADVLQAANIPVKVDLPGVGSNLQEHIPAYTSFNVSNLAFPNANTLATNPSFNASAEEQYAQHRTGPWATTYCNALAFIPLAHFAPRSSALATELEAQQPTAYLPSRYTTTPTILAGYLRQRSILLHQFRGDQNYSAGAGELPTQPSGRASAALQKPLSRGTVTLNATDPHGYPVVTYHSLQNPVDKAILCDLIRFNRRQWASPALAHYAPVENVPGAEFVADDAIIEALVAKDVIKPAFAHPSGSCEMMLQELGGCVSNGLLVYVVRGLSIVDASILPMIPATHLQATMYAIAEKAADIIKDRR
ncbi:alcohol oxidase [Bimuria novae-zelandiae CBS 107.79]|uniref:Alcohol oxidase n=1 Tax=Bimuria novae-zelandiae CBS 107.79 TaxID=1447943 RepID=A0A6A5VDH9_9PLEO|nr:alcohol oxidase [Bimuria novae-zelandiae CBS 107.79]